MSKIDLITEKLKNVWNNIDDFIEIENSKILYITDVSGQSYLKDVCPSSNKYFKINNIKENPICQLPIDGKNGLLGFGASYCDTIVFNNNLFCFLELKHNATSTEVRAINKNRKKAIKQLSNTVEIFDNKLEENYVGLELEAIVSTPDTYPRQDTAWESLAVEFLEKYSIPLSETTEKEFE